MEVSVRVSFHSWLSHGHALPWQGSYRSGRFGVADVREAFFQPRSDGSGRALPKISVKCAKISQNIRQISLNFSQNFVPIWLRVAVDTELRRADRGAGFGPPAAVCNEFTFNER